jgi:hypothetical protein
LSPQTIKLTSYCLKIAISILQIRLQIVAFGPLIPGLDEYYPVIERLVGNLVEGCPKMPPE